MASLGAVLGYWNHLLVERKRGRVCLAPRELAAEPTVDELRTYIRQRQDELLWYVRGIDAGGDDPIEFGPDGEDLLQKLGEARGFLTAYAESLDRGEPDPRALREARGHLLRLVATIEQLIADLMDTSDAVRHEALATHAAMQGHTTDDGMQIGRSHKVPRNSPCPCGSGKKWKKCCGSVVQPH